MINDEFLICSTVTEDFNDLGTNWYKDDITNSTGQEIDSFTSSAGYKQIIDKLTHAINKSMPCIDLIFCTNQIIVSQYGADASIFDKCHENIIYGKIDIYVPNRPKYVREVWDYNMGVNCGKALESHSIDPKVDLLMRHLDK